MASRLPTLSEESEFSVSLAEAVERAERLDLKLLQDSSDETPASRLGRHLSHRSIISTASSFAQQQEQAALDVDSQWFEFLDNGWCGDVFAYTGKAQVLKRAKNHDGQLWNDFLKGSSIHTQFSLADIQKIFQPFEPPRIPTYDTCIAPTDEEWWSAHGHKFPSDRQTETRMPILIVERILPLPKAVREDLIDVFCQPKGRTGAKASPGNRNCIARLYLGKRRISNRPSSFFRLKNFSLHLDQAEEIGLDIEMYATEMAIGLAICHWRVCVDANYVEFVLGSAPTPANFSTLSVAELSALPPYTDTRPDIRYANFRKRTTHLWMLDFDKCYPMTMDEEGVKQAVKAAEDNDPYIPRPHQPQKKDQHLWQHFRSSYLEASSKIMAADKANEDIKRLPVSFVDGWEAYRREKLDRRVQQ